MSNNTPPVLADLFNKILVNFNRTQSRPQVMDVGDFLGPPPSRRNTKTYARDKIDLRRRTNEARKIAKELNLNNLRRVGGGMDLGGGRPAIPSLNLAGMPNWDSPAGFFNRGSAGSRRGSMRAARNGTWHPLARVKTAIADYLPAQYSSRYRMTYNFGPGRPSGTTIATKVKWRKLLGDVFSINGMGRLRYTKGQFKTYGSKKIQRRAMSRRAKLSARY